MRGFGGFKGFRVKGWDGMGRREEERVRRRDWWG